MIFSLVFLVLLCSFVPSIASSQTVQELETAMDNAWDKLYNPSSGAWASYMWSHTYLEKMITEIRAEIKALGGIQLTPSLHPATQGADEVSKNRLVNDSDGVDPHKRIEDLTWTETELQQDKRVHIRKFPRGHQVKLFRIASGTGRTEDIVTNDLSQSDATATKQECRVRWKIEQLHRELKQTTGISKCQSRQHRGQRNHIACCLWVWVSLTRAARATGQTIYHLKESLYHDYMRQEIENPSIVVNFA